MINKPTDDGGPAFPSPPLEHDHYWDCGTNGMSLRDYFAAKASDEMVAYFVKQYMQVLKTNEPDAWKEPLVYSDWHCEKVAMIEARYRYALADAMLKARER